MDTKSIIIGGIMRHKFYIKLLLMLSVSTCALGLFACAKKANNDGGHSHKYVTNIIAPTCVDKGYTVHTCIYCDDEYKDQYTDPTGIHTPKAAVRENEVESTYETEGSYDEVIYCDVCDGLISSEHKVVDKLVPDGTNIYSKSLTVEGSTVYGKFANGTASFSFADDILVADGATYKLCTDSSGANEITNKIATLVTGDNTFYLIVKNGSEGSMTYTVTLRVRPLYTVSFDSTGSTTEIPSQQVEEDGFATKPSAPTPFLGYEFSGWSYDLTKPITQDTEIAPIFVIAEEMRNFIFTSTMDTCIITGVHDNSVTEIIVPDYVTEISEGSFSGCSSLYSITLPFVGNVMEPQLESDYRYPLGYVFGKTSYTGGKETLQSYKDGRKSLSQSDRTTYYIPESLSEVTITGGNINYGAFYNCTNLTKIELPDGLTSIGKYAFYSCRSLISIELPEGVTIIDEYAFDWCESLTNIKLPNSLTSIEYMAFIMCFNLTSIKLPDGLTSIGFGAFSICEKLESIEIPSSVTFISASAFQACTNLTSVTFKNASGWRTTIGGIHFSSSDLSNPSTAATYLTQTYSGYEWIRDL